MISYSYTQTASVAGAYKYSGALVSAYCNEVSNNQDPTTNTLCVSCFVWGTDPRVISSSSTYNCLSKLTNTIPDCEAYNGTLYETNTVTYPRKNTCAKCKKDYYVLTQTAALGKFSATCSKDKGSGCNDLFHLIK